MLTKNKEQEALLDRVMTQKGDYRRYFDVYEPAVLTCPQDGKPYLCSNAYIVGTGAYANCYYEAYAICLDDSPEPAHYEGITHQIPLYKVTWGILPQVADQWEAGNFDIEECDACDWSQFAANKIGFYYF